VLGGVATTTPTGTPTISPTATSTPTPTPTPTMTLTPSTTPTQGPAVLDIDHDGVVDALTDGLLALRYLFGFGGVSLTAGAVSPGC